MNNKCLLYKKNGWVMFNNKLVLLLVILLSIPSAMATDCEKGSFTGKDTAQQSNATLPEDPSQQEAVLPEEYQEVLSYEKASQVANYLVDKLGPEKVMEIMVKNPKPNSLEEEFGAEKMMEMIRDKLSAPQNNPLSSENIQQVANYLVDTLGAEKMMEMMEIMTTTNPTAKMLEEALGAETIEETMKTNLTAFSEQKDQQETSNPD